jgi:hypothetical protein
VLFYVLFVCKCVLPPGDNPIAVNKCHITRGPRNRAAANLRLRRSGPLWRTMAPTTPLAHPPQKKPREKTQVFSGTFFITAGVTNCSVCSFQHFCLTWNVFVSRKVRKVMTTDEGSLAFKAVIKRVSALFLPLSGVNPHRCVEGHVSQARASIG